MATILSKKKSSYGSPYAYYVVDATVSARTPSSVNVTAKVTANLQYSSSLLGTGNGFGLVAGIYVGGAWHTWTLKGESTSWSGTAKHSKSTSFTVSGLTAATASLTGVKFRCLRTSGAGKGSQLNETSCSNIAVTQISSKYTNAVMTADTDTMTQKQVGVTLSGLPSAVGFATSIDWLIGETVIGSTAVAATATATAYAYTFTGLLPNVTYALKANIKYGATVLVTTSIAVTTPQETGELVLSPKATYVGVAVSGMFDTPNYTRSIELYYKKDEESDYKLFSTETTQGVDMSKNITSLISNSVYDIKVLVKNGTTTLLTLIGQVETAEDTSLLPTAIIEQITQRLGTRLCTLSWVTDKAVAGTNYVVEVMSEEHPEWEELASLSEVISPLTVESIYGNESVIFRIKATNESVAEGLATYSEIVEFYVRDDFLWDLEKIAGQPMIITANEWNRLRDYTVSRNADNGIIVEIPVVSKGDNITAHAYNMMKAAISNISEIDVPDRKRGDKIIAADIDALRVAINTVA